MTWFDALVRATCLGGVAGAFVLTACYAADHSVLGTLFCFAVFVAWLYNFHIVLRWPAERAADEEFEDVVTRAMRDLHHEH